MSTDPKALGRRAEGHEYQAEVESTHGSSVRPTRTRLSHLSSGGVQGSQKIAVACPWGGRILTDILQDWCDAVGNSKLRGNNTVVDALYCFSTSTDVLARQVEYWGYCPDPQT
jgi:hypothetical protein